MLDLLKHTSLYVTRTYKNVLLLTTCLTFVPLPGFTSEPQFAYSKDVKTILESFKDFPESADLEEMVDYIFELKGFLEIQGYQVGSLSELCLKVREYMFHMNYPINDFEIEKIYNLILERENNPRFDLVKHHHHKKHHHKKHKKSRDIDVSNKFASGFMKFLAGSLCCIIPHPAVVSVGVMLIGMGISDMTEESVDPMKILGN